MNQSLETLGLVPIDTFSKWAGIDQIDLLEEIRIDNLQAFEIDGITYVRVENPKMWIAAWSRCRCDTSDGIIYSLEL